MVSGRFGTVTGFGELYFDTVSGNFGAGTGFSELQFDMVSRPFGTVTGFGDLQAHPQLEIIAYELKYYL